MFKKSIFISLSIILLVSPGLAWAQKLLKREVTEIPIARVRFSPQIQKTFTVSPDSRRIAFAGNSIDKRQYLIIDGKDQPKYDEITDRPTFSPDSQRIAYIARRGNSRFVVIDGKEERPYDDIPGYPAFSPDSKKVAYVARTDNKELVVINGDEQEKFDEIGRTTVRKGKVIFSPDSTRLAYVAREGRKQFVIVDGTRHREYESVGSNALWRWDIPVFSPDGKRLAYQARIGTKWFAVVDGVEEEGVGYDAVYTIVFSPDSKRLGYIAKKGEKDVVVIDRKESKEYEGVDLLTFSPDGKSVAYRTYMYGRWNVGGRWFFILNGQEKMEFKIMGDAFLAYGGIVFSSDGKRVAYKTRSGIVIDGKEERYEKTGYPVFSPDSQNVGYIAGSGDKLFSVINGQQGKIYDTPGSRFFFPNPVFSPDSKHVAYAARMGKKWSVIIDAAEGQLYDEILVFPGGEKSFESFDDHPYYHGYKDRIDTELAVRGKIVFDSPNTIHYLALKGDTICLIEETIK
jgi:roadblock/LC7 domain-containing protein